MPRLNQVVASLDNLINPGLVGVHLLLKVLMLLALSVEICWVKLAVIAGNLQLLVDPSFGFIAIPFKLLKLVQVFQHGATNSGFLQKL